jgi:transposase InsO family protein
MDQRLAFINAWLSREFTMSELCHRFTVSRPTGYKWLERFQEEGCPGLEDRSCAPHHHPNATTTKQVAHILALKRRHADWGPVTLRDWLCRERPNEVWPAASTFGEVLKRHGLVRSRRRRRKTPAYTQPFAEVKAPNDIWSADFKGHFAMGDERRCWPLTLTDNYSRYLLCCQGFYGPQLKDTQRWYERCFIDYGLPRVIRTDNGFPFASTALGGLTPLSVWLLKLGILPERIDPGEPQQNGRHERFHRTLKAATANPPSANLSAQQRAFNRFRHEYNEERPHRALGQGRCPNDLYRPSSKDYPTKFPEVAYPDDFAVRKVKCGGYMKWRGEMIYVTKYLLGEHVGLRPLEHDRWEMYFCQLPLGIFDERLGRIIKPSNKLGVNNVPGL